VFGDFTFFKTYPYFLPCAVPATFTAIAWIITYLFFEEVSCDFCGDASPLLLTIAVQTIRNPVPIREMFRGRPKHDRRHATDEVNDDEKPVPIRSLFIYRVLIGAVNYTALSLVDITYRAIQPLFFSTPIFVSRIIICA
jgi:hypothetical protein